MRSASEAGSPSNSRAIPEMSIRAVRGPAGRVQARNASTGGGATGAGSATASLRKGVILSSGSGAESAAGQPPGRAEVPGLFKLTTEFEPKGDQPEAIRKLVGLRAARKHQVLLGVTGSGKTFTMAKVIEAVERPTLVLSHNKTLAAQLYQEFRRL